MSTKEWKLLAEIQHWENSAYSITLMDALAEQGLWLHLSSVHALARKLERKGLIRSKLQGTDASRIGRRRKCYELTASGSAKLNEYLMKVRPLNLQRS